MPFLDGNSLKIGSSPCSAPAAFTPSVRLGIGVDAEDFRLSPTTHSGHFSFPLLQTTSPLMQGYWQLRSTIFCQEQHLFEEHDRDDRDDRAYPIAAIHPGAPQFFGVVGVVRGQSISAVSVASRRREKKRMRMVGMEGPVVQTGTAAMAAGLRMPMKGRLR